MNHRSLQPQRVTGPLGARMQIPRQPIRVKGGSELARALDVAPGDRFEDRFEGCLGPAPLHPLELHNAVARVVELCAEAQYRLTQLAPV